MRIDGQKIYINGRRLKGGNVVDHLEDIEEAMNACGLQENDLIDRKRLKLRSGRRHSRERKTFEFICI